MHSLPKRKTNRLPNYDYTTCGGYFITVCLDGRKNLLRILPGTEMDAPAMPPLSHYGRIVQEELEALKHIYPNVVLDKYCIMPDHIHCILLLLSQNNGLQDNTPSISRILKQFKGKVTKRIGHSIWQKSFYDRVIRNDEEYTEVWKYIDENPLKWELDFLSIE